MARTPIIHIGDLLIAPVREDLRDGDALLLQEELTAAIVRTEARGVLLDISVVEIVDSFLGRLLGDIATGTRLFGAYTVVVGMQPAVAITLVELGVQLRGVRTALNVEKGMRVLRGLIAEEHARDDTHG